MPSLKITLSQLPVLTDPAFSVKGRTAVVGTIAVTTSKALTIGGLKLQWTTGVSDRVQNDKSDKVKWGKRRVIDSSETMVLDTEQVIPAGTNQYEFVIDIPVNTLDTRTTHFDKTTHTLSAGLLSASPCYDEIYGCDTPTSSYDRDSQESRRPSAGSLFKALRQAAKSSPRQRYASSSDDALDGMPLLAVCTTEVPVYKTCCTIESDPSYRYAYQGKVDGLNANFVYSLSSSNFALGGLVDIDISLKEIPQDATIHALHLTLRQTTQSIESPESDKAIDEYALWSAGSSSMIFAGRARPSPDAYVWRGPIGRSLDNLGSGHTLTLPPPRLRHSIHLPSPIIGAVSTHNVSTTLTESSSIAEVGHTINLEILYSRLGQGPGGSTLPPGSDRRPIEGILRSWKFEKEVIIANDTRTSGQTAPPGYSCSSNDISPIPTDTTPITPSALIPWKTTFGYPERRWLRPVTMDDKALRKRVHEHFTDTEGFCECFMDRPVVEPTDWSRDGIPETIDVRCKV